MINFLLFIASPIRYYICYHGKPMPMNCPAHLHWNEQIGKCDTPENAKCDIRPNNANATDYPTCPDDALKFFPHPDNCNWFLYCNKGHMTVQQCPYAHLWDYKVEKCLDRNIAKCAFGNETTAKMTMKKQKM